MNLPNCKRCLLEEIDPKGVYQQIADLIGTLPKEEQTEETEYRRRLSHCTGCSSLGSGICGKCGCFVELRAAQKKMHCPHEEHFW